ncbi:MAG: isoprenyl transferase [Candidatus Omnitrophica bacterium]|nr:isoprenyl transferase [Candidatus Omnitrophota bacterium]
MTKLPRHIAIIMDGNGRWAREKNLPKIMGHRRGVEIVDRTVESCAKLGIGYLTLYTFSTENWKRSGEEVSALMKLLEQAVKDRAQKLKENNIRFNVIGQLEKLPKQLVSGLESLIEDTSGNSGMVLSLALSYSGRQEIVDAVKKICTDYEGKGRDVSSLDEENFGKYLYTSGLPDPDLMIRTSGEMRISNFLLWQLAYSEFYVTDTLWPDFDESELNKALEAYSRRDRRFGE